MAGGIGLATAAVDCLAETEGDLMFLADDEIIVLSEMRDGSYLVRRDVRGLG